MQWSVEIRQLFLLSLPFLYSYIKTTAQHIGGRRQQKKDSVCVVSDFGVFVDDEKQVDDRLFDTIAIDASVVSVKSTLV